MKFSFLNNDKRTFLDEVILGVIAFGSMIIGMLLIVFKPNVWIIDSTSFVVMGVMVTILGVMFVPCLIYRLMTNDK